MKITVLDVPYYFEKLKVGDTFKLSHDSDIVYMKTENGFDSNEDIINCVDLTDGMLYNLSGEKVIPFDAELLIKG